MLVRSLGTGLSGLTGLPDLHLGRARPALVPGPRDGVRTVVRLLHGTGRSALRRRVRGALRCDALLFRVPGRRDLGRRLLRAAALTAAVALRRGRQVPTAVTLRRGREVTTVTLRRRHAQVITPLRLRRRHPQVVTPLGLPVAPRRCGIVAAFLRTGVAALLGGRRGADVFVAGRRRPTATGPDGDQRVATGRGPARTGRTHLVLRRRRPPRVGGRRTGRLVLGTGG
ncbi:hypothetical protein ACWV95_20125 [Streptomyces albus]